MALSKDSKFWIYSKKFFDVEVHFPSNERVYKYRDWKRVDRSEFVGAFVHFVGRDCPSKGNLVQFSYDAEGGKIVVKTKGFSTSWEGRRHYHQSEYHVAKFEWVNDENNLDIGNGRQGRVTEHIISHNAKGANHSFYK